MEKYIYRVEVELRAWRIMISLKFDNVFVSLKKKHASKDKPDIANNAGRSDKCILLKKILEDWAPYISKMKPSKLGIFLLSTSFFFPENGNPR